MTTAGDWVASPYARGSCGGANRVFKKMGLLKQSLEVSITQRKLSSDLAASPWIKHLHDAILPKKARRT